MRNFWPMRDENAPFPHTGEIRSYVSELLGNYSKNLIRASSLLSFSAVKLLRRLQQRSTTDLIFLASARSSPPRLPACPHGKKSSDAFARFTIIAILQEGGGRGGA